MKLKRFLRATQVNVVVIICLLGTLSADCLAQTKATKITVRNLFNTRSGTTDYVGCGLERPGLSNKEVLSTSIRQPSLGFTPGEKFEYSDSDSLGARVVTSETDLLGRAGELTKAKNHLAHTVASPRRKQPTSDILEQVVSEICGKKVALLGESPTHGFGKTLQFKVEITRLLIDQCHFNAFFIESGIYDFLNIEKKLKIGQEATESMVAAAIGGIWANQEVRAMIPFLLERARQGRVVLGGLCDQLGAGTYAQLGMPSDLVSHLEDSRKTQCLATLQKHMLWQYGKDSLYGPKDKARS